MSLTGAATSRNSGGQDLNNITAASLGNMSLLPSLPPSFFLSPPHLSHLTRAGLTLPFPLFISPVYLFPSLLLLVVLRYPLQIFLTLSPALCFLQSPFSFPSFLFPLILSPSLTLHPLFILFPFLLSLSRLSNPSSVFLFLPFPLFSLSSYCLYFPLLFTSSIYFLPPPSLLLHPSSFSV